MKELWDYESRLNTTTSTDDGQYDQVLALSQGTINDGFSELYDLYKDELSKLCLKDEKLGTFEGTVEAPRILIQGADQSDANPNEILFETRFTSGRMEDNEDEGIISIPDLNNWIFYLRVPIVPEKLPDPSMCTDLEERRELEERIERLKQRFNWPGDYSIGRLYMMLSAADWGSLVPDLCYAGSENGKPLPYVDWSGRPANTKTAARLRSWLSQWSSLLEKNSRNLLGLSFEEPNKIEVPSSVVPISVLHQTHQYKSAKNGAPNGETGFSPAGNCNCLLYLEMIEGGGAPPRTPRLNWSGNFATQGTGPDFPPVRGTYLANPDIIFTRFLLAELRPLHRASECYFDPVYIDPIPGGSADMAVMIWHTGTNPDRPDSDGAYDFVADPGNNHQTRTYHWRKKNQQNENGPWISKLGHSEGWGRLSADATMESKITWTAGRKIFNVDGVTAVSSIHERSTKEDVWDDESIVGFARPTTTVKWSVDFKIESTDNIGVSAERPVAFHLPLIDTKAPYYNWPAYFWKDYVLYTTLYLQLNRMFRKALEEMQQRPRSGDGFTYPGSNKLDFSKRVMSERFEMNTQVRFKPLERDEIIIIPTGGATKSTTLVFTKGLSRDETTKVPTGQPTKPAPLVSTKQSTKYARKMALNANSQQLAGAFKPLTASAPDQTSKVLIENETQDTMQFTAATVTFRTGHDPAGVFVDTDFEYRPRGAAGAGAKDAPTQEETSGVVELRAAEGVPECEVQVSKQSTEGGLTTWQLQIRTVDGRTLALEPGAWLEVDITGTTGARGEKQIEVDQAICDAQAKHIGVLKIEHTVLVS